MVIVFRLLRSSVGLAILRLIWRRRAWLMSRARLLGRKIGSASH